MSRVLIVDDEPESRARLRAMLQAHGHTVAEASNGLDALALARAETPDLVVSDILMPQMDGFAFCRASRADPALARAPFVFYTGTYTTATDAALARRLGATRFLVKSMAAEEVIRALTESLQAGGSTDTAETTAPDPDETESWRLYNESLIARLEHRNLELLDQVRDLRTLERALDHVPTMVSVADMHGRIAYVNAAFASTTGYGREHVQGQTHAVLRPHADAGLGFEMRAAALAGRSWQGELEQRRRDGSTYLERLVVLPIRDDRGAVTHFLRVGEDITAARRDQLAREALERGQRQQERADSIGRLAGGVAHDFNNLLTVVVGHAHLVLDQLAPNDPLRTDLEAIVAAGARGAVITRQLLTFARRDVVHPLTLDPGQAIAALARPLQRLAGDDIRLSFSLGPGIWPVRIDPAMFDQVVEHLVTNGRDAIDGAGAIDLSLTNVAITPVDAGRQGGLPAGDYVCLRVHDTGRGIAPDVLPRVFEPFFTTRPVGQGTGLGLSTVSGAVAQANGHVEVERTGPDGTTMRVLLPRASVTDAADPGAPDPGLEGTERILLVEDEPAVLELTRRTLESHGYTVLHASTPARALKALQEGDARVDLLLTDVMMPGMNGRELAVRLRALDPHVRVLFMSGYSSDVVAGRGLLPAGVSLITKPFSPTALAARVRAVLDAPPPHS